MKRTIITFSIILLSISGGKAQVQTVGLFDYKPGSFTGYTLFQPVNWNEAFLIDNCGKRINSWNVGLNPGLSVYFTEEGNLLSTSTEGLFSNPIFQAAGASDNLKLLNWDSEVIWDFNYSTTNYRMHHDVELLPNGNILLIAWEFKSEEEALSMGRDPDLLVNNALWPDKIVEIQPVFPDSGVVVWEWHFWDHLIQDRDPDLSNYGVVANHPELIDINAVTYDLGTPGSVDWIHLNSVSYNPDLDQILLCSRHLNEIYIIDHSTTIEEAAGHIGGNSGKGGDILYRWGNPEMYKRGSLEDRRLFGQHDATWIWDDESYSIMLFNNGINRPDTFYSSVDIIELPLIEEEYAIQPDGVYGPDSSSLAYKGDPVTSFYSGIMSGTQLLPNGNILICEGRTGHFFEVNDEGDILWDYVNPVGNSGPLEQGESIFDPLIGVVNTVFKIRRYSPNFQGFSDLELVPAESLEINPLPSSCETISLIPEIEYIQSSLFPNPASSEIIISLDKPLSRRFKVFNSSGIVVIKGQITASLFQLDISTLPTGVYFIEIEGRKGHSFVKIQP